MLTFLSMRYLGIDYGSKRIGLALSDEEGRIAFPHKVIEGGKPLQSIEKIKEIIADNGVGALVIGHPISFGGKKTPQTKEIEQFATVLSGAVQLPVELENEILSSKMLQRQGVPKEHLDASAAAIILQSYLDKQK